MNIETIREYCLSKPGVNECFPFDETTLVFKVMDKMFALTDLEGDLWINLKCDPEMTEALREEYSFVLPGFHMNKKHWNTIYINSFVPTHLIYEWIDNSYGLVVGGLTKKQKNDLVKMKKIEFELTTEYIELIKLLKFLKIADSGGQAKMMVENGEVVLNGVLESRKRAKIRKSDKIEIFDIEIIIK